MLPFPIFLFLLLSAALLAPPPPVLVGSFKITTLQSFEWSTLDTPPNPQSPPEDAALFSLVLPSVTLNTFPTQCGPTSMHMANNPIPHSFVHATDDHSTNSAVLFVVLLAMFNCFVYLLLVDESNGARDTEGKSEQPMQPTLSTPAAPPLQETMYHPTPTVNEMLPPFFSVDVVRPVSESLEHKSLSHLVKDLSISSFEETTIPWQSPVPLGQSLPFPVLSCDLSLDDSEGTTDGDSTLPTLPASGPSLIDAPSVSVTQPTAFEALSNMSVESTVRTDDSEEELPKSTPLDTEAAKGIALPLPNLSSIPHPQKSEPSGILEDNSMSSDSSAAVEDACELDADEQEVFYYQPPKSENDGDETFEYEEVDCTLEAPTTPPTPTTEDQALPSLHLCPLLESRDHSLGCSPLSAKKSTSEAINSRSLSRRFSLPPDAECTARYASDDIQMGMKRQSEGKIVPIIRCASANDLSGMFKPTTGNAAHAFTISDRHSQNSRCDIIDDTVHNQVTLLRADAPIFKPRSLGMNEVVSHAELRRPVSVGLEASIHAPQSEEVSQTQGCARVSQPIDATGRACSPPTTDTPERPVETSSLHASIDVAEEPTSSRNAQPTRSTSPKVTGRIHASIHAPPDSSTGAPQAVGENIEKSGEKPTHAMTRSSPTDNGTQDGLHASIHAPARCRPSQSAQRSSKHSTDVPNWAAISRAQNSSTAPGGGFQAQCGNSPDPAGAPDLPTTTRCAARDQEGGTVDNSDGSLVSADDQEGTTGSGETDNTVSEADDSKQDSTKPSRRPRRRGKPRRPRQKVPYVPPPRMRDSIQHPAVDVMAQGPASLSSHHYTHAHPLPPHHSISAPGPMVPPNGIIHDQFGQHSYYNHSYPHVAPIPGFQPPGLHNPRFYPLVPHH